ncbi:MAG: type II secretion system protein GspC [Gammaproteobacteria bacterium]|nr:type II secretion system protein GspC [Gammaproteobacteria bacterium]
MDGSTALVTANRVLPPWLSLLLVVLIGWQIAKIIWMLVPAPAAGDAVDVPTGITSTSSSAGSADVSSIASNHMFGQADANDEPALQPVQSDTEALADTRKNLVLKGTIASDLPEFSVAVIEVDNSAQKVYAIGDSLGTGATLHEVHASRVVLNENGALTNLRIPTDFPVSRTTATRRNTSSTRQAAAANNRSIQSVVSQNLSSLTEVFRPTPYIVNGEQVGYRVYPGRNRQQFAALGLRPGDLIKDIDGQSLSDPTQAVQVFESLGTAQQVTLTIERNGQPQSIILKTSQLDLDGEQTK